jgi:hypothetical protein
MERQYYTTLLKVKCKAQAEIPALSRLFLDNEDKIRNIRLVITISVEYPEAFFFIIMLLIKF